MHGMYILNYIDDRKMAEIEVDYHLIQWILIPIKPSPPDKMAFISLTTFSNALS